MKQAETVRDFTIIFTPYLFSDAAFVEHSHSHRHDFAQRNEQIASLCKDGRNGQEIANIVGLTRARVGQILKGLGLQTTPRKAEVPCSWCRKPVTVFQSLLRHRKNFFCSLSCSAAQRTTREPNASCLTCGKGVSRSGSRLKGRIFCSQACYHSVRQNQPGKYIPNRQGQRKAREVVAQYFDLKPEHVVHHEDRDNRNNDCYNLRVFRSQSDHMAYHHGVDVVPIWDGRKVEL